jgi:uncharacterized protein (DUF885 family)
MLKEALSEYKKVNERANADLTKVDRSNITAHRDRVRTAKRRLPEVKLEYKNAVRKHLAIILVTGSQAEEFGKLAEKITGDKTLDAEGLYKDIVKRMPKEASSGKMAPKVIVDIMTRHLEQIASEVGIESFPRPHLSARRSFVVKDKTELDRLVKRVLNENQGSALAGAYLLVAASELALANEFDGETYPVIATITDSSIVDEVVEGFNEIFGQTKVLTAGSLEDKIENKPITKLAEVSEETVTEALKAIKTTLGKKARKSK